MFYTVDVSVDEVTGELIIPLDHNLLQVLGWIEGDTVDVSINNDGNIVLEKIN